MIDAVHLCPVLLILSRVNGSPGRTMNNSVRSDLIYGLPDSFPVSDVYLIIRRADHRAAILNAGIGRLNVRPDNLITSGCRVVDHIMSQLTAYTCHKYFHNCPLRLFYSPAPVISSPGVIFAGILACILLIASGFASGSEIAFFSLSPNDLNELDAERNAADEKIEALRKDSERTLATILITNNLVNVTIIMLCNYCFAQTVDFGKAYWLEFVVITVLLTFLLLLFGEIMPKVYCGQHALSVCRTFAGTITFLSRLFHPLATVLIRSGVLAEKLVQKESHVLSVDDLEQALELTDKAELKEEQNMLEGIVRFGDETAKEVMTSRQDVVDLDFSSTFPEVLKCIVENNYSRIPVIHQGLAAPSWQARYVQVAVAHTSSLFCAGDQED